MQSVTRIPLCAECLTDPEPLRSDYTCVCCKTPFLNRFPLDGQGRCALCRSGLRGFDAAYCYGSYEGRLREWIHLYKYSRIKPLARPLGKLLAAVVPREEKFDAVVPVPLHWLRRWHRGFNQSEILARGLGKQLGVRVVSALRRTRSTQVQAGLSNTARRQNVSQAFRGRRGRSLAGQHVLLVDDVMTTGSTAAACARALKQAGAARVTLVTVARVDRRMAGAPRTSSQSTAGEFSDGE